MADSNGDVLEHRYVMAQHLGRLLTKGEIVHHINHDRTDNRLENLQLLESHSVHVKLHAAERPKRFCACGRKHYAFGLCQSCYDKRRRQYSTLTV